MATIQQALDNEMEAQLHNFEDHQEVDHQEIENGNEIDIDENEDLPIPDLTDINLQTETISYEKDFCLRIAEIISPEYSSTEAIQKLIKQLSELKRWQRREQISLSLQLYNKVYINNILNTQMTNILETYKDESEKSPNLELNDRHRIEKRCIKNFEKLPPAPKLILTIHNEFLQIFRTCHDKDKSFISLFKLFFRSKFMSEVFHSALYINRNPLSILPEGEDNEVIAISSAAQHVLFVIQTIRSAIKEVFKENKYFIAREKGRHENKSKQDNKAKQDKQDKHGKQDKNDGHNKKKQHEKEHDKEEETLALFDTEVLKDEEINTFFKDYILEIVRDQIKQEKSNLPKAPIEQVKRNANSKPNIIFTIEKTEKNDELHKKEILGNAENKETLSNSENRVNSQNSVITIQRDTRLQSDSSLFRDQMIRLPELIAAMRKMVGEQPQTSAPGPRKSEPQGLTRNALSIIDKLTLDTRKGKVEDEEDYVFKKEQVLVISTQFGKGYCARFRAWFKILLENTESPAAAISRIPFVGAVIIIGDAHLSFKRYGSLSEGSILEYGPYLIFLEVAVGLIETFVDAYEMKDPQHKEVHNGCFDKIINRCCSDKIKNYLNAIFNRNAGIRVWKALKSGSLLTLYCTNVGIRIYLVYHPEQRNIKEKVFMEEIMSVPLVLMGLQSIWVIIPPLTKEHCFTQEKSKQLLKNAIDVIFKTLYNSGVFYLAGVIFADKLHLPKTIEYQIALPLSLGFPIALGQHIKYLKEKLNFLMICSEFSMFFYALMYGSFSSESNDKTFEGPIQVGIRTTLLVANLLYSGFTFYRYYKKFIDEYQNEDDAAAEIIGRRVYLPVRNGKVDTSQVNEQGALMEDAEYKLLEEDMRKGDSNKAVEKTLLFMQHQKSQQNSRNVQSLDHSQQQPLLNEDDKYNKKRKTFCDRCVIL